MKKIFKIALLFMAVSLVTPVVTSCSEDSKEETVTADTSALKTEIEECEALLNTATTDDYPQEAIDDFRKIVDQAKAVLESNPSQTAVDNLLTQLKKAKESFLASAYDALPSDKMVCAWDFETEGNEQVSTGTKAWKAVLASGPSQIFGSAVAPSFVEGLNGGKAISLDKGAHLEVADYTANDLLKDELTLSVWVKVAETFENNYILSINSWHTMKLQLQGENKPFCTINNDAGVVDADNETPQSFRENEWGHLVVTISYKTDEMKFYVNGELTKTWTVSDKPALAGSTWSTYESPTGSPLPMLIGSGDTIEEALTWDELPSESGWAHFKGAIDNLKMFTVALTEGQIKKLYNDEKGK